MPGRNSTAAFVFLVSDSLNIECVQNRVAVDVRVHTYDLFATMLLLLGRVPTTLTERLRGSDIRLTDVSGRVVCEIISK